MNLSSISNVLSNGASELLTVLVNPKNKFPHVPQIKSDQSAHFPGTAQDFLASKGESFSRQMNNKVRVCTCGKPVAFTLPNCNGCGLDLTKTPITTSTNIFSSFVYGVQKGAFPYTISMRGQDENVLVFDDLLALTPAHLNVIPTNQYVPDWRYLCNNPREGLKLIDSLYYSAWKVLQEQYLSNKEWRSKIIKGSDNLKDEEFLNHLACGCNYPPSQYQLHLQFMLPPFLPQHWLLYLKDLHFTYERFFPVEYIRAVLCLNIKYKVVEDTKIEDIIAFYNSKGVNYQQIWRDCYDKYAESHKLLSNWSPEDFDGIFIGDSLYAIKENNTAVLVDGPADSKAIQAQDKLILQNYGRPYNDAGKPTGGYYSFARDTLMPEPFNNS